MRLFTTLTGKGEINMQNMPPMLAFTVQGSVQTSGLYAPFVIIGQGGTKVEIKPPNINLDDSYWFLILDNQNPKHVVQSIQVPAQNNTTVPAGLDALMSNPAYLFAFITQSLWAPHIPQGNLYKFLATYGAGRELERAEQWAGNGTGCGHISRISYILAGQCGPRKPGDISPPSFETFSIVNSAYMIISLMPGMNGQPPYGFCNHPTFITN